jgi:hypothetical protein
MATIALLRMEGAFFRRGFPGAREILFVRFAAELSGGAAFAVASAAPSAAPAAASASFARGAVLRGPVSSLRRILIGRRHRGRRGRYGCRLRFLVALAVAFALLLPLGITLGITLAILLARDVSLRRVAAMLAMSVPFAVAIAVRFPARFLVAATVAVTIAFTMALAVLVAMTAVRAAVAAPIPIPMTGTVAIAFGATLTMVAASLGTRRFALDRAFGRLAGE